MKFLLGFVILLVLLVLLTLDICFMYTIFTSDFMNRMTIYDLRARSSRCKYYYMWHYYKNTRDPTREEKLLIKEASNLLEFESSYIKIMKKDNREENMPHTIGEYIILPYDTLEMSIEQLRGILKHEMVHIKQRYRTRSSSKDLKPLTQLHYLRRNNPDTDDKDHDGSVWYYTSEYPKNVNDIVKSTPSEHIFEKEAYS